MKIAEARNTEVFVIEGRSENHLSIEKVNLYDWVCRSIDETTTPHGVAPRVHLRVNGRINWEIDEDNATINGGEEIETIELWTWGVGGNNPRFTGYSYSSIEEGGEDLFARTEKFDFMNDDQRNTCYYNTAGQALEALAEMLGLSVETVKSIEHHRAIAENIKDERRAKELKRLVARREMNERIANEYVLLIEPIENESYKETASRLSGAIGSKIDSDIFHKAVKLIRNKLKHHA